MDFELTPYAAYNLNPPGYHACKLTTHAQLLQKLGAYKREYMNGKWQLTTSDDANNNVADPLAGLSRMGMVDLFNLEEGETVAMVVPASLKIIVRNLLKLKNVRYLEMKRSNRDVLVFQGVKIPNPLDLMQLQEPQGNLKLIINGNPFFYISLNKHVRDGGQVEFWKKLPQKLKITCDYVQQLLLSVEELEETEKIKRLQQLDFLLTESQGDVLMVTTMRAEIYQRGYIDLSKKLANQNTAEGRRKRSKKEKEIT